MKLLILLSLFFLSSCHTTPAPSGAQTRVEPLVGEERPCRIVSWNVRNLFDTVDDPNDDDVMEKAEYARKLAELAAVIDVLDPDFIGLQEIENANCVQELNSLLARPFPQGGLIEGNDQQRGIDVAFLSRLPVSRVLSHKDHQLPAVSGVPKRYRFSRDCLEVQVESEPAVSFLINHLKSQRGDAKGSASKRRAQAGGILELARLADKPESRAVVILGDLNDRPDSWALEPLFQNFEDAFKLVPKPERVTHRFGKEGSALDHILLDPQAKSAAGEFQIWKEIAHETSDHNPISQDLRLIIPSEPLEEKFWTESD